MIPTVREIEVIEDLPLRANDKWYVLLAFIGKKRASWLNIESDVWREGDSPIRIPDERVQRLTNAIQGLGLTYRLRFRDSVAGLDQPDEPSELRERFNQICDIFIGDTEERVNELAEAVDVMDHKRIGFALDYPKTAVDVFGTEGSIMVKDATSTKKWSCKPYVWFKLSHEHSEEELAVVQDWYDAVKEYSQVITNELTRRNR